ncbi:MAG: hypothetical protein MUE82_06725 [Chloroflexi bacterium]|nr:hypothetical protein [Chloroflexota bacterium]
MPHTEDEYVTVPFPCAVVRADKAEAALAERAANYLRMLAEQAETFIGLMDSETAAREDAERLYKALRTRRCLCTATHPGTCLRCAARPRRAEGRRDVSSVGLSAVLLVLMGVGLLIEWAVERRWPGDWT